MAWTPAKVQMLGDKTVSRSRQLQPGGGVGPGSFSRRRFNIVVSSTLLHRINDVVPRNMKATCGLPDTCVPIGKPELVGQPVYGDPTKRYIDCNVEERVRRMQENYNCAVRTMKLTEVGRPRRRRRARGYEEEPQQTYEPQDQEYESRLEELRRRRRNY